MDTIAYRPDRIYSETEIELKSDYPIFGKFKLPTGCIAVSFVFESREAAEQFDEDAIVEEITLGQRPRRR